MAEWEADPAGAETSDLKQGTIHDVEEPIKSDDVTVCFSVEELDSLEDRQKERNKNVKTKIHQTPNLVGYLYVKPEIVPRIHRGEELCVRSDLYTQRRKNHAQTSTGGSISRRKPEGGHSPDHAIEDDRISPSLYTEDHRRTSRLNKEPGNCRSSSPEEATSSERGSPIKTEYTTPHEEEDVSQAMKSHRNVQAKKHKCSECGACFNDKSLWLVHQTTHTGPKHSTSVKHGRSLISIRHQGIQTGEESCSYPVRRKHIQYGSKQITERRVQRAAKSYTCKECGKSFTQNASLIVHKRTHTGERPHTCEVCGKSFISGSYLVMHQRVHTGERPYVCNECGKRFISSSNLIIHKRVHTGEKPYLCTECGKCFGHSSHLVRHQKVHTGERPFTCAECGKAFSRSSHLVRHQTIHTRSPANHPV
ncbi:uncharacterized protein LOC142498866 isoform X1 [Ascaphus truei]|uniref:uncharacterized protein LOC142498866 isoform X1 n=1 Tax=Ascaphus truei TaxID=8439 RepID=UPI003F5AB4F5